LNYSELKDIVNDLALKGIKCATFNDDLKESARLFYVGPKLKKLGRLAGELMGKFLGGKGNILVFWDQDYNAFEYHERMAGFNDIIAEKFPGLHVVGYINPKLDWFLNMRKTAPEVFNDVSGIYAYDLDIYLPEIESLPLQPDGRRIVCIGHEFSKNVARYLKDGAITACIKQDAYYQGYKVIKELFECIFNGCPAVQQDYDVKFDIVVAENADQYMEHLTSPVDV
jgi:LacI family transcriptional regulator